MRITQWGEYGILCLMYFFEMQKRGHATVNAKEISDSQKIDIEYSQQILQRLRRAELLKSIRGAQGGYALNKDAAEITLYEVLRATEGDTFEVICEHKPINSEKCLQDVLCSLKTVWYGLRNHIDDYLKKVTIAELVTKAEMPELVQIKLET